MTGAQVLVVDDHPANAKLAHFLLEVHGYEVRVAYNADEALEVLSEWVPQVILMDVQMPGMDGLTLTRLLRERDDMDSVIIIALTAYAMASDRARALDAGCDDYVAKPFDTRALPRLVAEHIARGRSREPTDAA